MSVDFQQFRDLVVRPVCDAFPRPAEATTLLMRIAAHESLGCRYLRQVGEDGGYGPARGPWQMEPGTTFLVDDWCRNYRNWEKVPPKAQALYNSLSADASLQADTRCAAIYARFLLFASKWEMPPERADELAFDIYLDVWRPGKPPTPETFLAEYQAWMGEGRLL